MEDPDFWEVAISKVIKPFLIIRECRLRRRNACSCDRQTPARKLPSCLSVSADAKLTM